MCAQTKIKKLIMFTSTFWFEKNSSRAVPLSQTKKTVATKLNVGGIVKLTSYEARKPLIMFCCLRQPESQKLVTCYLLNSLG